MLSWLQYTNNIMCKVVSVFIDAQRMLIFVAVLNYLYLPLVERCHRNVYNVLTQLHVSESFLATRLVKKFPFFYGTWNSLPHSEKSATGLYPEPDKSSPHIYSLFLKKFQIFLRLKL
jgi:hypothetical protein